MPYRLVFALAVLLAACGAERLRPPGGGGAGGSAGEQGGGGGDPGGAGGEPGGTGGDPGGAGGGLGGSGGSPGDGSSVYGDADVTGDGSCMIATCSPVDDGCGGAEVCGDGLDNDCDGRVDEGCTCAPGSVQPCFLGPPGRRHVGACQDGSQRCIGSGEFGEWGECAGGLWPTTESCDTQDNNCNGCTDDHSECCQAAIQCPGSGSLPEASPFTDYVIDGTQFFSTPATSWSWTVVGGPCDQLLQSTSGRTSYTLTGADSSQLTFHPTLSGDYLVHLVVMGADGQIHDCTFIVHVRGPGLRVELCWDTTGMTDIDLHVHRPGTTTDWFTTNPLGLGANPDDCFYATCKAAAWSCVLNCVKADWGYPMSSIDECVGSPSGPEWQRLNYCANPRLDVDNVGTPGIPENVNIDTPENGATYRVMTHYYGGLSVETHPLINVYCGGQRVATYGEAPDLVGGFTSPGHFGQGPMWRVVDVTAIVDSMGTTTSCAIESLHPPGMSSGYFVTNGDRSY